MRACVSEHAFAAAGMKMQPSPPLCGQRSLSGCKLAMECQQVYQNVNNILVQPVLTRVLLKVRSVFQKWDTGKYTYNFKELLTCHPRVERARSGEYHESDYWLQGERLTTLFIYKCRLLITLVNSLDPDQVKSADDKKHRKYSSLQRVHWEDWTCLNWLMGACHLLRCRCVGQLKTFDTSSWTRGPNFVSSLYHHQYFEYISNKW